MLPRLLLLLALFTAAMAHATSEDEALQRAQALGDGQILAERGRPVLRLHLTDRAAGLVELMQAIQQLPRGGAA